MRKYISIFLQLYFHSLMQYVHFQQQFHKYYQNIPRSFFRISVSVEFHSIFVASLYPFLVICGLFVFPLFLFIIDPPNFFASHSSSLCSIVMYFVDIWAPYTATTCFLNILFVCSFLSLFPRILHYSFPPSAPSIWNVF